VRISGLSFCEEVEELGGGAEGDVVAKPGPGCRRWSVEGVRIAFVEGDDLRGRWGWIVLRGALEGVSEQGGGHDQGDGEPFHFVSCGRKSFIGGHVLLLRVNGFRTVHSVGDCEKFVRDRIAANSHALSIWRRK